MFKVQRLLPTRNFEPRTLNRTKFVLSGTDPDDIRAALNQGTGGSMAEFDIVIHGGRLIDGTGNPWFYGDVGIKNGKIASVGKINPEAGQRAIAAKGYVVTP